MTRARRELLVGKLSWLDRQRENTVIDVREQERIIPANPHSELIFADGSAEICLIIDMSTSGVAVSADTQPAIGTPLAVGRTVGRVVRHFREGFAVKFIELQERSRLKKLLIRP